MTSGAIAPVRRPSLLGAVGLAALLVGGSATGSDRLTLVVLALAVVVATVLGPTNAVAAVGAMLPFVFITAHVGNTEWGLLELALLCCAAGSGVELARRWLFERDGWTLARVLHPIDLTLLAGAMVAVGTISLAWVADTRGLAESQRELRRVLVEPLVVILAVRLSRPDEVRQLVARSLALSGLIVSAIALAQVGLRSSGVEVGAVFRPIGTYPHPNNLALYLERVVWTPLALGAGPVSNRIAVSATCIIAVACGATLSRGAVLALVVGATTWLVLTRRRPPWRLVCLAGALAAGMLLVARLGGDGTESLYSRSKIWSAALDMIRDNPITGSGINQFYQNYGTRYVAPGGWGERYTSHPHNLVLDFWLQFGLAGLLLLAGMVWLVVRRAAYTRSSTEDLVSAALIAGVAGGLAHGLIDNGFFLPDLATFLWLALALTAARSSRAEAT